MEIAVDVPHYFLCPISLQIMKDPVTLPSGATYDRASIEKWLFSAANPTCPLTKLPLSAADPDLLTPNHTLRRLIQAWCTLNSSHGIERFPTPKPPITRTHVLKLLNSSSADSLSSRLNCLRRLRSLAADSETNRRCILSAGAADFLASLLTDSINSDDDSVTACDEALSALHNLLLSDADFKPLTRNREFFDSLAEVMKQGSYESRAYAVMVLRSMVEAADPLEITHLGSELFVQIVQILKDQPSKQTSRAALQILIRAGQSGRNRVKAVEAGAVGALVEILLAAPDRRVCEMALTAAELLCGCAEGRAALLGHGGGIAVVSKKILRVSQMGSERAVRILHWIAKFSGSVAVLREMLELGIVAKLCLVLQVESGSKTKEKAREILKMHSRVWRNSPCIPLNLASSFPVN